MAEDLGYHILLKHLSSLIHHYKDQAYKGVRHFHKQVDHYCPMAT